MKAINESIYSPLKPQFDQVKGDLSLESFAKVEALLYLLYRIDPSADPQKAYLLFSRYQVIGAISGTKMDYILQCARKSLRYYRSQKNWQDDLQKYLQEQYCAFRAFDVRREAGKNEFWLLSEGYPYCLEKRKEAWEHLWVDGEQSKKIQKLAG